MSADRDAVQQSPEECPRCGEGTSGERWCRSCGLNLHAAEDYRRPPILGRERLVWIVLVSVGVTAFLSLWVVGGANNEPNGDLQVNKPRTEDGPIRSFSLKTEIVPGESLGPARLGASLFNLVPQLGPPRTDGAHFVWRVRGGDLRVLADVNDKIVSIYTDSSLFNFAGISVDTPYKEARTRLGDWTDVRCFGSGWSGFASLTLNETQFGPSTSWSYSKDPETESDLGLTGFNVTVTNYPSAEECVGD